MFRFGRGWYWVLLTVALIAWGVAWVAGPKLVHLSHFTEGSSIRLYLHQLRLALLALPVLLLWLKLSKRPGPLRWLNALRHSWLNGRATVPTGLFFFLAATVLVAALGYHRIPLVDAIHALFQTKLFARGRLYAPAPPDFEFFRTWVLVHDGRWFSHVSPGQSLVLLPGYLLGNSWLTGPLLGVLGVLLLYRLTRDVTDEGTARLVLLLSVSSPFMVFLFASQENHVSSLFFTILSLFCLVRWDVKRAWSWSLAAGLSLGMVFLTRPYTAAAIGLPLMVFVLLRARARSLPFFAGGLVMVLLHLAYNRVLFGNAFEFGYELLGNRAGIGFGADYGDVTFGLAGHSPLKMLINLSYETFALSLQLFGWLFLSLLFVVPAWCTRRIRRTWLVWGPGLALIIAYAFYWFHGVLPWGPKFWSEALPAFILLTALGIRASPVAFRRWFGTRPDFARRALPFLIAYSLIVYMPVSFQYFAQGNWGETPKVANAVRAAGLHNALVFVHTDEQSGSFDYTSAFLYNDPWLRGDIVYARDLGPSENPRLMRYYTDRAAYLYDFNYNVLEPLRVEPSMSDTVGPTP